MRAYGQLYSDQRTVQPGSPEIFDCPNREGVSVSVNAGVGNQALVEYTCSPPPVIQDGNATWFAWPSGQVNAPTIDGRLVPTTAVRVTAFIGAVVAAVAN